MNWVQPQYLITQTGYNHRFHLYSDQLHQSEVKRMFQLCPTISFDFNTVQKKSCTKTEEGRPLHSLHPQARGWACLWLESRCPCPWHGCQHHTAHTHLPPGCWPGAKTPSPPSLLLPAAKQKVHSKSTSTHNSKHITEIFLKFVHDQSTYSKSTKTLLFLHTVKPIYFYHYQQVCYHHHPTPLNYQHQSLSV